MLPDYEKTRIPEGHYKFQIVAEPEKRSHTGQSGKKFVSIKFPLKATAANGATFDLYESFLGFEEKYADLLIALGAEEVKGRLSGQSIDPVGMMFQGDVVYEPDKNDASKNWTRIQNINAVDDLKDDDIPVASPADKDDTIPF